MIKKEKIIIRGRSITYALKSSKRAKKLRLTVGCSGLTAVAPYRLSQGIVESFIQEKAAWIIKSLDLFNKSIFLGKKECDFESDKEKAMLFVKSRLEYYNVFYDFKYAEVRVKDQRTRWGSCSGKRNLNFNFRLLRLPQELADYVIVHELCHLKELNHSRRFWLLVEKAIPDCQSRRKKLKRVVIR